MAAQVTIVAHDIAGAGGMEQHLRELVTGLLERDVYVTVVSRTLGLAPHERLRWRRVPGPSRPFVLAYPWYAAVASLMLLRRGPGALHTTGAIVLNRADVCTVHYVHNDPASHVNRASRATLFHRFNGRVGRIMSRAFERFVYGSGNRSALLVAVSEPIGEELSRAFPQRSGDVRVIGNGVDTKRFAPDATVRKVVRDELGLREGIFIALFVGSEWRGKGLDIAIDALAICTTCHLVVVGDGDATEARRRAVALGVDDRLKLVGETSEPERYYAAADAFVLPSAYESFSIAAFEAAASGLPVVATAVGAIPALIEAGGGIQIDAEPDDLAAALERLERNPSKDRP